jgi:hypothetical protein
VVLLIIRHLDQKTLRNSVQNAIKMKQITEEIFPIQRDIDDHIDDFDKIDL